MQTDWEKLQSETIDWLRFPMAVAVVMIHHGVTLMPTATGPLQSICILFEEGVCRLAVPFFFFSSGFLFFNRLQEWDWGIWTTKVKRRVHTLLLPYILWNIIAFFVFWIYTNIQGNPTSIYQFFHNSGGLRIFWGVNGGFPLGVRDVPFDSPLWFVRDLMYYTLAAPVLFYFIRQTKIYGLLLICLAFYFVPGIIPEGFMFFITGAWFQVNQKNMVELLFPIRKPLYLFSAVFLAATYAFHGEDYWGRLCKSIFMFVGIGTSFCSTAHLIMQESIHIHPFLSHSSFFIYTSFEILILHDIAQPLTGAILPNSGSFWPCLEFFLTPALAVGLCLGLFFLLERLLPRATAILTGGRMIKPSYS